MRNRICWPKHIEYARELRKNQTPEEQIMWECLRNRKLSGYKFLRQHVIMFSQHYHSSIFYIADFYCAEKKFVLEIDGVVHKDQFDYDRSRDLIMKEMNLKVQRVTNEDVTTNLHEVLQRILTTLIQDKFD